MLSREIGSSLLFDRYIIPAALNLFTKRGVKIPDMVQGSAVELQEAWFFSPSELASICLTFEMDERGGRKKRSLLHSLFC